MPTKPTSTYTHATDATFGAGPAAGNQTKAALVDPAQGFVPGSAVAAETVNELFNISGQWITDWVSQGSTSADLDAHIVETDANGLASILSCNVGGGGALATITALSVVENAGNPTETIDARNSSGGTAVAALAANGSTAISATASLTGFGIVATATDTCDAIIGQVFGSGEAITGISSGSTGTAIKGSGSTIGGPVLDLEFDGTIPQRGTIAIQPISVLGPSAPSVGDLWVSSDDPSAGFDRRGGIEIYDNFGAPGKAGAGNLRVWATPGGSEHFSATATGPIDSPSDSGGIVSVVSITIPKEVPVGKYAIRYALKVVGYNSGAGLAPHAYVGFKQNAFVLQSMAVDLSNPANPATFPGLATEITAQIVSGGWIYDQTVSPAGADITFEVEFQSCPTSPGALEGARALYAMIEAVGVFDG